MSGTVVKTIFLSLVSQTGLQNSTAPPTSSSDSTLASNSMRPSGSIHLNATTSAAANPALVCIRSSEEWSSASRSWVSATRYYETFTTTTEYDNTTFSTKQYTCTSSCGTTAGAISYCGSATDIIETTHVSTEYVTSTITNAPFPTPEPNCTIASSDCSPLITSWSSALAEYENRTTSMPFPESPACSSCVATGCTFQYGSIDLYYYPVTKNVSRDMCTDEPAGGWENSATITADPDSTYTEVTTGSYTVVNGVTMYEGNIYISLADPYVLDSCRNSVAPKFNKPRIITMASSDLYSVRGYPHNIIPYSIQWADFQDPVPWSAYVGQSYCANNRVACTEVIPGSYLPAMSMPGQIRQLDPNWASCDFDKYGLFDPPIALHGVPNFLTSTSATADPTPTSAESVISATPGQSSNGDMPTATSKPQLTESSTDLEDPASSTTPEDPAPSSSQTPTDPQEPAPSNTEGPSPQDPTPSGPQTLSQSQNPAPSSTQVPAEPQVSDPSTQQDPSPSESQDITLSESLDPAPSATRDPSPNGPQEPSPSASAINDPQNSIPSSTQGSSTNVPQDTVISQNPPTDPNANPTGTAKNGPSNPTPPAITIGPTVFPINPTGGVVVETGTALSSGGASVVISSSTFNIGSGGLTIVSPETSAEIPFGTEPVTVPIGPNSAPVVLDPAASTIIIGGTTLAPGGAPITVDDTILSVGSSGVVVAGPSGTSTIANPTADGTPAAVTVGSDVFPITSGSIVLGPGTILGPGDPAVTISDTVFSVDSTGLVVIGNGKTSILPVTLDASSRAGATSEGSTGSSTATGAGSSPSQTGDVEFSGVAANIGWSKTLIVALLGAIYVIL